MPLFELRNLSYYVGYILFILTEIGLLHGFINFLYPKFVVEFLTHNITAVHYGVVFFALNFALKYFKLDIERSCLYFVGRTIAFLMLPMALTTMLMKEYQAVQIYFAIQGAIYLFILWLLAVKIRENFSWAKYYFISWLPIFIGAAITPMLLLGKMEYSFWARNALLVSVMVEASLMAMALADRLRSTEERILHSTTHDQRFDLPNNALMANLVNEKIKTGKHSYSYSYSYIILVAEIQKYHSFSPYLADSQLKKMTYQIASILESSLKHLPLLVIDANGNGPQHSFLFKDGIVGIVIESKFTNEIHRALMLAENAFPAHFESKTMNISLNCVLGLATSSDADHPILVASKALQVINSVKKSAQFFGRYDASTAQGEQRKIVLVAEFQIGD